MPRDDPEKIFISPDGRRWRHSRKFVTRYSTHGPTGHSLNLHYTTLRDGVQEFIRNYKIDPYYILKTHDAAAQIVGMQLYWEPIGPSTGDRP